MNKGSYSGGKRDRDAAKARKKRDKDNKRARKRMTGTRAVPITTAEAVTGNLNIVEEAIRVRRAAAVERGRTIPSRLFVGSLSWNTTGDDLREAFSQYGPVTEAVVVNDRDTGKSRGFGFVVMENHKDVAAAIDGLNGSEMDGRTIVVNVATERGR